MTKRIITSFAITLCLCCLSHAGIRTGTANSVLGQYDFLHNGANITDANSLSYPYSVAVDTTNDRVYVADRTNNRILWWNGIAKLVNGGTPDGVLGQPDFISAQINQGSVHANTLYQPLGICLDGTGNLWVADTGNNRVIRFSAPITIGMNADFVLGEGDFVTNSINRGGNTNANTLNAPRGVYVDKRGRLWVADTGNNRVLRYTAPFANGMNADLVLGQSVFTSSAGGQGYNSQDLKSFIAPAAVAVDKYNNIWVIDSLDYRILRFSGQLSNGMNASLKLDIFDANGLWCDDSGNLWVTDGENRIVKYSAPVSATSDPSLVLGQKDFSGSSANQGGNAAANTLNYPSGIIVDPSGNVWVADSSNNRVLKYCVPISTGIDASLVLGQSNFNDSFVGTPKSNSMNYLAGVAIDKTNNRIFVADTDNNRVLWWNNISELSNGKSADGVLGQSNFTACLSNRSGQVAANTLSLPSKVAIDASGNVWVSDTNNCRVLRYSFPQSVGKDADIVLGQKDFVSNAFNFSRDSTTLCWPNGIALDASGNLWVIDSGSNRVVRFRAPFKSAMAADMVLGQNNFNDSGTNRNVGQLDNNSLNYPFGVAVDSSSNVWIADTNNHRILRYPAVSASKTNVADMVLGQTGFSTANENQGGSVGKPCVSFPEDLNIDAAGGLWVADTGNSRLIRYSAPFTKGMDADYVIGQVDLFAYSSEKGAGLQFNRFINRARSLSETTVERSINVKSFSSWGGTQKSVNFNTLCCPAGLSFDASGNLWVADMGNNRVLEFVSLQQIDDVKVTTTSLVYMQGDTYNAQVNIPSGAFSDNVQIAATVPQVFPNGSQAGLKSSNIVVEVSNDKNLQPQKEITITVTYSDTDIAGLDEANLVLCYYDAINSRWVEIPSTVYPSDNKIVGRISHFSIFRVFQRVPLASLNAVIAYPNPYYPGSGSLFDNSVKGQGVVFSGLTSRAKIRIFTISGQFVRELEVSNTNGTVLWDTRNDNDENVASGVYIYLVTNPDESSQKAKGKIAIIR